MSVLSKTIALISEAPLLLLFLVAAIGYPIGRVRVLGTRIGVASVLFTGLALGSIDSRLKLPELVYQLGLVLFVYPVGLASGPAFFAAFRRKGLRDNFLVAAVLCLAMLVASILGKLLHQTGPVIAGLFAGSLTNTPALAAVMQSLSADIRAQPVIGYSIAYPIGVLGVIAAIGIVQRWWKIDYQKEAAALRGMRATSDIIANRTIRVTNPQAASQTLKSLSIQKHWTDVVFTRFKVENTIDMIGETWTPAVGAQVIAVGAPARLDVVEHFLGERSNERFGMDRSQIDYRRVFVSNPALIGRTLREIQLPARYGGMISRIRRGDIELLPSSDTTLELGDHLRVVAKRGDLEAIAKFFGDSYRAISEVDVATFSLGLFAGLLLGMLPIPLPGGMTIRLGLAGGPLIVGLLLGAFSFTGPLVWTMPYSANLTIRQFGLVLFLAGIGTQAGYSFIHTLTTPAGAALLGAGAVITLVSSLTLLFVGYRMCNVPMSLLTGMVAGLHTQPAVLSYATEQSGNDLPNVGYATVYPTAIVAKIVLAQVLLTLA